MPATLRKLILILPISLFFSVAGWGQTTAVEGTVTGTDGKGVQGAMVHLERKDMKGSYKVKTDKKGHYYYGGLPIGTFRISVEISGKEADAMDNVRTKLGDPIEVPFDLKAASARAGGAEAPEVERGMSASQKADFEKKRKENEEKMAKNKELNDAFNAGSRSPEPEELGRRHSELREGLHPRCHSERSVGKPGRRLCQRCAGTKTGADQQAAARKGRRLPTRRPLS